MLSAANRKTPTGTIAIKTRDPADTPIFSWMSRPADPREHWLPPHSTCPNSKGPIRPVDRRYGAGRLTPPPSTSQSSTLISASWKDPRHPGTQRSERVASTGDTVRADATTPRPVLQRGKLDESLARRPHPGPCPDRPSAARLRCAHIRPVASISVLEGTTTAAAGLATIAGGSSASQNVSDLGRMASGTPPLPHVGHGWNRLGGHQMKPSRGIRPVPAEISRPPAPVLSCRHVYGYH